MLCRTLLTAIAISYLICVLWLSGLQKEDLDVNMLRKLQRHNVNIDDMNSESLRKICLNYKLKNNTGGHTVLVDEENRTTEATIFSENIDITRKILKAENDEMSQMLNNIVDNQENVSKESPSINRRRNSKLTKILPIENEMSVQNSSQETTESTNQIKTTKSETIEILYRKKQPNLSRVIQFWQKFSTANTLDDINIVTISPKPKINSQTAFPNTKIEDAQNLKDFGYINSFFMDLINKNTKVSSTTTTTTTTTTVPPMVDLNNLSNQIKTLMELLTQRNKDNLDEANPDKSIYKDFNVEKSLPHKKTNFNFKKEIHIKNKSPINIHDMLMFNDRLKKSSIISSETNQTNDRVLFVNEERKSNYPYNVLMDVTTDLPVTISTTRFATKQTTMLSKDVINEIAENVKAIVLKDLQMSIASTTTLTPKRTATSVTPTITTTTLAPLITTTTDTVTNSANKPDDSKNVLEKFMELFEQLKTIKDKNFRNEKTTTTKTTTIKTCVNDSEAKFFAPPILQISSPMLLMDAYRIKKPPEINPIMLNSYPTIPVPNVQVYRNVPVLSSHVVNPFLPNHDDMKINVAPIIQTNLEEIPPLGIPMSKPSILIHQNIIVTTKQPHNSSQIAPLSHRVKYLSDSDHSSSERNRRERFYKHLNPSPSKYLSHHLYTTETSNAKDYFKFSSRLTYPRHISAASLGNNKERITHRPISYHNSRYETFLNGNSNDHYHETHNFKMPIIHQSNNRGNNKRERFHEKLERIVDWHEDGGRHIDKGQNYERNKLNIISRQQKPLGEMKKPTKFDDTHFQNFLHSQQKVNEMLEKILTSKTVVANEPISVEIA